MSPIEILFPLIFIVLCGFISAKIHFIPSQQLDGLRTFIFSLCIPTLLFSSMYQADLSTLATSTLLLTFYLPVACCFIAVYMLLRGGIKKPKADAATLALAGTYSNTVLVGLPIILTALGEHAGAMVFMIITFHSAMLFSFTFLLATRKKNKLQVLKPLIVNPIVLSISGGLAFNYLGIPLPKLLTQGLDWLAKPAIPGALFILGASLVSYGIKGRLRSALGLSLIKLLLLPAMVYGLARVVELPPLETQVITLMSASPLGVNAYLVARQLDSQQPTLAATVVLSTLLSMVSLTGWLYFII